MKYIKEQPKDEDEELIEEYRREFETTISRTCIGNITWWWENAEDRYGVEISHNSQAITSMYLAGRTEAIELYYKLVDWWLKK